MHKKNIRKLSLVNLTKRTFIKIILFLAFIFSITSHFRDLWGPDETRYVQIAKEIIYNQNIWALTYNQNPYPDKPPFAFWLIALMLKINHYAINNFLVRLPFITASLLLLYFTYLLAKEFMPENFAVLSALLLLSSENFWNESIICKLDMMYSMFFTIALYFLYKYISQNKKVFLILFWISLIFCFYTKGPVIFVPFFISFYLFKYLRKSKFPKIYFLSGLGIIVFFAFIWIYNEIRVYGIDYFIYQIKTQIIDRISKPNIHKKSFLYFFIHLPIDFPFLIVLGILYIKDRKRFHNLYKQMPEYLRLLAYFSVITVLFFSLFKGKRYQYILPIYSSMSIFSGYVIYKIHTHFEIFSQRRYSISTKFQILFFIISFFFITYSFYSFLDNHIHFFLLLCFILITFIFMLLIRNFLFQNILISGILVFIFLYTYIFSFIFIIVYPSINHIKSTKWICEIIQKHKNRGERYVRVMGKDHFRADYMVYGDYFFSYTGNPTSVIIVKEGLNPPKNYTKIGRFTYKNKYSFVIYKRTK